LLAKKISKDWKFNSNLTGSYRKVRVTFIPLQKGNFHVTIHVPIALENSTINQIPLLLLSLVLNVEDHTNVHLLLWQQHQIIVEH
jgi:hypothetical protein